MNNDKYLSLPFWVERSFYFGQNCKQGVRILNKQQKGLTHYKNSKITTQLWIYTLYNIFKLYQNYYECM